MKKGEHNEERKEKDCRDTGRLVQSTVGAGDELRVCVSDNRARERKETYRSVIRFQGWCHLV